MRRIALGIIGMVLLAGGIALPFASEESWAEFGTGVLIKTGAVTLLICLAYHQLVRLFEVVPPWLLAAVLLGLGTAIVFPKSALVVLGILAALVVLHVSGFFLAPFVGKTRARTKKRKVSGAKVIVTGNRPGDLKSEFPPIDVRTSKRES